MKSKKLNYCNNNVIEVAKSLLGNEIFTNINGEITSGIITETEAYNGENDKASHAFMGKKTKRNEAMYMKGGVCYVYLCYGIHYLLNIVTAKVNCPKAVLIRAIKPVSGIDIMLERRSKLKFFKNDHIGPGKVSKSLGINLDHNKEKLNSKKIWIEEKKIIEKKILAKMRIGIEYAEEDALLPYRFILDSSVSF
tara:strand:+ start:881 stop:1462 length:582 start_codon:yes stop_codon:yes gene_type:complete